MHQRERIMLLVAGLLVGGWVVDSVAIGPGLEWLARIRAEGDTAAKAVEEAQALVDRQKRIMDDWRARHAAGLLDDEDGVRYRVQQALVASARTSAFTIDSVSGSQRVPAVQGHAYDTLRMTVTGQGTLAEVQAFLAGIETAAVALRIERCEMAARDARKDQLDLSLTLSTCLVAKAARGGRSVPPGAAPWRAGTHDGSLDAAILAARPFLADRRSGPVEKRSEAEKPVVASAPAAGGWALVGIVSSPEGAEAFLRHLGDGKERLVRVGDEAGEGMVSAITDACLILAIGDEERQIPVGYDLAGLPIQALASSSAGTARTVPGTVPGTTFVRTPSPTGPVPSPFQVPTTPVSTEAESILQRLRQQRNRASGAAP